LGNYRIGGMEKGVGVSMGKIDVGIKISRECKCCTV